MKTVLRIAMIGMAIGACSLLLAPRTQALNLNPACTLLGNDCNVVKQDKLTSGQATKNIVNNLLYLVGALSVIMIIAGGIRYVISQGEAAKVATAKNTVLYAVIGLIVSVLAYAIVQFVVKAF